MKILPNYTILKKNKTIPYQILAEFTGEDLAGTTYEQLIPWFYLRKILKKHLE